MFFSNFIKIQVDMYSWLNKKVSKRCKCKLEIEALAEFFYIYKISNNTSYF